MHHAHTSAHPVQSATREARAAARRASTSRRGDDARPSASTIIVVAACAMLATITGCGGVQFDRADGAHKYRALPVGTEVVVSESGTELAQPTVDIGELLWKHDTTVAEPNLADAKARFVRHAARYGCDAVVGLDVETAEKKSVKKTKSLGPDGRPIYKETEVSTYSHTFKARCVRTSAAPGGLVEGGGGGGASDSGPGPTLELPKPSGEGDEGPEPEGAVTDADVLEVWAALARHRGTFLKNWADRLGGKPSSAQEALDAMNELMAQVSGPAGLWRKRVPMEWFGCGDNPQSEQCVKLAKAAEEFPAWDHFAEQMMRQKGRAARSWLKRNKARILGYMSRYVPSVESLSGLQGTPLFAEKVR